HVSAKASTFERVAAAGGRSGSDGGAATGHFGSSEPGARSPVVQCRGMSGTVLSATEIDLEAGLRRLGYESFRPGQREAIETLMTVGRVLLVAPTGGGKSLSYQLPAVSLGGTTLVISPLVALMNDQVQALTARCVSATFLAS